MAEQQSSGAPVPLLDSPRQSADRIVIRTLPSLCLDIFLLALASFSATTQAAVETTRTIRVVMDNAYAPYSFQSDSGNLQGILIDQWQAWENKTGIKVELHSMDWDEAIQRMRAGEFDVIDSIVETTERRSYLDFTSSYAPVEVPIFFRNDISGITDLESLRGFPVGVKAGDQHVDKLKAVGVTTLISFQNNEAIVAAAKEHKINVFVVDAPSAIYLLNKAGIDDEFRRSAPIFRDDLRRAVRKGDAATLRVVSEDFAAIRPAELQQINEKWIGSTINQYGRYLTYAGYAAAMAMLLIAGLIGWNRLLNKRILQRTAALSESEQRFRRLVELMPVAVYVCDVSGMIQIYNNRSVELWGREPKLGDAAELYCGSLRLCLLDGTVVPHEKSQMADVLRTGVPARDVEVLMERPDGSRIIVLVNITPLTSSGGEIVGAINCFQDITERKQVDEALRQNEFELAEAQRVAHIGSWTLDIATNSVRWSKELYRIFDIAKSDFANTYETFLSRIIPEDVARVRQVNSEARSSGQSFELEYRITTREGARKYIREIGYASKNDSGAVETMFGTAQDITERKRAENALRDSALQLQALSRRLVDLQESERKELARELHDRIGQNLTALGINLEILRSQANGGEFDLFRPRLQDSAALVESTADAIENLMSELRPPMLDDYGLLPALDWYAKQFAQRTGIGIAVRGGETTERAVPAAETALFRIAQEALNNVAKHARATHVDIVLEQSATACTISIEDNGAGFDSTSYSRERPMSGLGMVTMRERTQAVGGEFAVQAVTGRGTRVVVRIPR